MKFQHNKIINTVLKHFNKFLIVIGIFNIFYCFFGFSLGWGFYFGLKVILISGILLLLHGLLRSYNNSYKNCLVGKLITLGIVISFISCIVMECFILTGAYINDTQDTDYILILGAGIIDDRPSLELKYRLDEAINFIENDKGVKKIILCGGIGRGKKFSEAYVMEKYLISHGINKDILIKEEQSTSTYENIKFAKEAIEIIDSRDNIKIAISSNDFHLFRAKHIAKKLGFIATGLPSRTPLYIIPNHHVREYFAIVKSIFS